MKSQALASGTYYPSSTVFGYDLALATTSFSVYKVTALTAAPSQCTNSNNQAGWGTWSIGTETLFATGTIPQNGDMFFEDNLWVRGQCERSTGDDRFGQVPRELLHVCEHHGQ